MIPGAGREQSPERPLVTPKEVARLAATVEPRWSALVLLAAWGAAALRYQHAAASRAAQVAEALGAAWVEPTQTPNTVRKIRRA